MDVFAKRCFCGTRHTRKNLHIKDEESPLLPASTVLKAKAYEQGKLKLEDLRSIAIKKR